MADHHHGLLWAPAAHKPATDALLTLIFEDMNAVTQPFWAKPAPPEEPVQPAAPEFFATAQWIDGALLEPLQQTMGALVEADELVPPGGWASVGLTKQDALDAAAAFQIQVSSVVAYDSAASAANINAWLLSHRMERWVDPEAEE